MPRCSLPALSLALLLVLGVWSGGAEIVRAQSVSVEAKASPNPVGTEDVLTFSITVRGAMLADIETPTPPRTSGLALRRGSPTLEQNVVFNGGRLTRSVTYFWRYEPVREGLARLRSTEVVVLGKTYTTADIRVEVVPQAQRPSRPPQGTAPALRGGTRVPQDGGSDDAPAVGERDLFIRALPHGTAPADPVARVPAVYHNEQLAIEYRLYFRPGIQLRNSRLANAWDAAGFWREDLDVDTRPVPQTVSLGGETYQSIALKRVAVFPTRAGSLRVDPLEIVTEAQVSGRAARRLDRLFSTGSRYERVELASDPLVVPVRPLPADAPNAFRGAVGRFYLDVEAPAAEAQVGQAVRLRVTIRGTGNVATLEAPALPALAGAEVYDPRVDVQIERHGDRVTGSKTFSYVIVPQTRGTLTIPPLAFAYFDPVDARYRTRASRPIAIRVTGDEAPAARSATGEGLPVGDVAALWTEDVGWMRARATPLHRQPWTYAALAVPALLAAAALALVRRRRRHAADTAYQRGQRAYAAATKRLADAQAHLSAGRTEDGFAALEVAVLGFVGDRLDCAAAGLTRRRLDELLANADVHRTDRETLFALLDVCDEARYSPETPSASTAAAACGRARELVTLLDDALPTATPPPAASNDA